MASTTAADIDEARIATLVERFYDKVRADPLLGPVFDPLVDDWDAHKVLMNSFWATVALRTGHYRGNPLARHRPLAIGTGHFGRWLALWRETAGEVFDAPSAALLVGYAERIGRALKIGMRLAVPPRPTGTGITAGPPVTAEHRSRSAGHRPPPAPGAAADARWRSPAGR